MVPQALRYLCFILLLILCPCATSADEAKHDFTLVIDAGHGGHDAGAVGSYSKEKDINLKVALAFGRLVEDNCPGVKVIYTRRRDVFIPLQRRADIANDAKADLFISIHTNALPNGRIAYGSETYSLGMARAAANLAVAKRENSVITLESNYQRTYQGFDPNKAESYVIFEIMQDKFMTQSVDLADCIQREYVRAGRPNKGVHQAGFLVLRNTSMPSVLTELGFITTPAEEAFLNSADGVSKLSRSIYNGFLAYRRRHDKSAHDLPANLPLQSASGDTAAAQADAADPGIGHVSLVPLKEEPAPSRNAKSDEDDGGIAVPARKTPVAAPAKVRPQQGSAKPGKGTAKPTADNKERTKATTGKGATPKATAGKAGTTKGRHDTARVSYRIQVGAGKRLIPTDDPQFKGLRVQRVKEGTLYKYFYGNYTSHTEARKALRTVQEKMPEAYIAAYINGKPASVKEARAQENK